MKFIYLLCMTIAIVQSSFAMIDMNSNGMSDIWERKYQVVGASPSADLDNDDQSNLAESLAGTNPNSDQSVPATLLANYKPSAPYVSWLSQLGVKYQVESSVSLVDGSWVNEGNEIIGLGGQMVTTVDAISGPRKFFRIKVVGDASSAVDQQIQGLLHDTDGDGLSDLSEILSGTDTFDPKSNWQSTSLAIGASTEITWKSEQGKYYQFMSRMSSGDPWINEGGLIMGTGDEMNVSFVEPSQTQREYTVTVSDKDSDGDGLNDWEEFQLGLEINFVRSDVVQGTDDMEYIQNRVNQPIVIQVEAEEAVANVTRVTKGGVRVYRTGGFDAVTVNYSVGGTAVAGVDYAVLSGTVQIPFGEESAVVDIPPLAGATISLSESVILTLQDSGTYDLGPQNSQQINVLKEVALDVMNYGAVGDGVADDTVAVQAALDALEASTTHNTLHFPQGTYRLNQTEWDTHTVTTNYRILSFGETDLAGRDIILRGETGSKLYSTVSPIRAHMLMVFTTFRSLNCYNMSWEKDSVPLSEKPAGVEPSGADGIALVAPDLRIVEQIKIQSCKFTNCHGAMMMTANGFDRRGHLRKLEIYDSELCNPYGSNTVNSRIAYGGGQQIYLSSWVKTATFKRNLFEGGGIDLTDQTTSPGGRLKDAAVFGSPLQMIFTDNTVLRMGVEAVVYAGGENWMTQLDADTVIPAADGVTAATVLVADYPSSFTVGQSIMLIKPTTPTAAAVVNVLRVSGYDTQTRMLTYVNDGVAGNVTPGTTIPRFSSVHFNNQQSNPKSLLTNNVLDGTFPPGADTSAYSIGFMIKTNALIKNNFVKGFVVGVMSYDAQIPYPGALGLTIDSNIILTPNRLSHSSQILGIRSWAPGQHILNNIIMTPTSTRFIGISLEGDVAYVSNNHVIAMQVERHSYTSYYRSVGIGVGNPSTGVVAEGNHTYGLDVGIGPENANQIIPHQVINHHSVNDVLPIDPRGLIE